MRQYLAQLIRYSGLPFLFRELLFRNRATIIVYHDPATEVFENHLAYLTQHFNIITLERLVTAIKDNAWTDIPAKSLVITFDDGHQGNFALLDILKKYDLPATIYACAGIVNTQRHYWFLDFAAQAGPLKWLPNQTRLDKIAAANGYDPEKPYPDRQALTYEEMTTMQANGFDFQGHTLLHPILTMCTDAASQREIADTKSQLEALLQTPVTHFAYPNGDYTGREINYVKQAGYHSARSIDVGWNGPRTNRYALKGMVISDDASLDEMVAQLCGIFPYIRYLRSGSLRGKHAVIQAKKSPALKGGVRGG